ncbi:hypothetical protein AS200_01615 [Streptomyces sp. CdTB01]|nr:hypothetical protein AS200_01615 [Streptomyces sp. CdTB01]
MSVRARSAADSTRGWTWADRAGGSGCAGQRRSRESLVTTDRELSAMAAAAMMGLSRMPHTG